MLSSVSKAPSEMRTGSESAGEPSTGSMCNDYYGGTCGKSENEHTFGKLGT